MDFSKITFDQWLQITLAIGGIASTLLARFMPAQEKAVRKWIKAIGGKKQVLYFIEHAATFLDKTNAEKEKYVIDEIQALAKSATGFEIPDSIIGVIVKTVYLEYKKRVK